MRGAGSATCAGRGGRTRLCPGSQLQRPPRSLPWGPRAGAQAPPTPACQRGAGARIGRAGGQHLLDSFIQVTPELPGIFEAPSGPCAATLQPSRRPHRSWPAPGAGRDGTGLDGAAGIMCAQLLRKVVPLALVLASFDPALGTEATHPPEGPPERGPQQKGRLSLQNTAEIQHCLVNAGDVGCGVFECFENNSCEIRGLHEICMTFLHNAGKFDAQGKSFIKDALKCKAHALRHKFSCISRKCPAIKEMVFQLQRECYLKHDLCSAAKENVQVIVEMIHFKDLLQHEPYVDLVNILLTCGEEVKKAITRSVQAQCEQNWGSLCSILSFCTSSVHSDVTLGPEKKPEEASRASINRGDLLAHPESDQRESSRAAKGERGSKVHLSAHTRVKAGVHSPKGAHGIIDRADELSDFSDIRR